ncbi:hypothetical protein FEM48_Zijuj02G0199500 [Ziziphus jujuba var. spinosa]|uniref:UDP-glycosyltransferase 92A1-like n=1 Tax=Ziziphus jujuba var. spinosa TaxID=714518 RepID=A0A978VXP0_ZIZJJ|nr:hypothetical protein FEM48_Zijuj02G0199500 [Ziziphus jujuba var. spinosa]
MVMDLYFFHFRMKVNIACSSPDLFLMRLRKEFLKTGWIFNLRTLNYAITFITTKLNIHTITSSFLHQNSSSSSSSNNDNIHVVEIPFCRSEHGLPPGVENLDVVPYHLLPNFLHASLSLKPSFTNLFSRLVSEQLGGHPPFCVIADMFFPWCVDVARHYGVFSSIFCSGGGFGFACYHSLWLNLPHRSVDSDQIITLPDFPEASTTIHITQMSDYLREADGKNKVSEFNRKALAEWSKADGILFNTVEDLDRTGGIRVAVGHEDLMAKIELVMNETKKGKAMRRKAWEMKKMIDNAMKDEDVWKGSSVKAMDEFLNCVHVGN